MSPSYAWVIDHTMTTDDNDDTKLTEDTEASDNGTTGPHGAPDELLTRLANGEGRVWRTLYDVNYRGHPDDQRICHTGRYLDWTDLDPTRADDVEPWAEFGPLQDLSQPSCGAFEIQYQDRDGTWTTL